MQDGFYAYLTGKDPEKAFAEAMVDSGVLGENNWFTLLAAVSFYGRLTIYDKKADRKAYPLIKLCQRRGHHRWTDARRLADEIASAEVRKTLQRMFPFLEGILKVADPSTQVLLHVLESVLKDEGVKKLLEEGEATGEYHLEQWMVDEAQQLLDQMNQAELVGPFCPEVYDPYAPVRACVLTKGMTLNNLDAHILFVRIHA